MQVSVGETVTYFNADNGIMALTKWIEHLMFKILFGHVKQVTHLLMVIAS